MAVTNALNEHCSVLGGNRSYQSQLIGHTRSLSKQMEHVALMRSNWVTIFTHKGRLTVP